MNRTLVAYEGEKPYIFVSYAHKNSEAVLRILTAMQENGYRIWFDQGIEAGTEWPEYIEEHLIGCERVLVFLSNAAVASVNCRNEINLALALKKELLIVYLEDTVLRHGLLLQLSSVQALFSYRYPSDASFLKELMSARLLAPCKDGAVLPKTAAKKTAAAKEKTETAGKTSAAAKKQTTAPKESATKKSTVAPKETATKKSTVAPKETAVKKATAAPKAPTAKKATPAYTLQPNASKKLEFIPINGGKSYFVSGVGACEDPIVVIPTLHKDVPVTGILQNAFKNATGVVGLSIPESVKGIPGWAFKEHNALMQVTVAGGVKTIGEYAFSHCASLSRVVLDHGLKSLGNAAFTNCTSLTEITLPEGLKEIPSSCFFLCSSLPGIVLPDTVTEIGESAFEFCSVLSEITLPKALKMLKKNAFSRCGLHKIELPDGVKTIGEEAFYDCFMLRSIRLPGKLTSIGRGAFGRSRPAVAGLGATLTFDGTVAQWNAVLKAPQWNEGSGIQTVHCTDGDVTL